MTTPPPHYSVKELWKYLFYLFLKYYSLELHNFHQAFLRTIKYNNKAPFSHGIKSDSSLFVYIFLWRFGGVGTRKFALKESKQYRIVCSQTIPYSRFLWLWCNKRKKMQNYEIFVIPSLKLKWVALKMLYLVERCVLTVVCLIKACFEKVK